MPLIYVCLSTTYDIVTLSVIHTDSDVNIFQVYINVFEGGRLTTYANLGR